ncbi:MAG TPA: hypothetical protein VLE95_05440 [Chlamydiales bacterium]|nr:hypothetical protein [Chlamydiales bacterium]
MSSAASATNPALHFPSQEEITAYLAKDSRTNDAYKKEKGIDRAVAKAFANSTRSLSELKIGVRCTIQNLYLDKGIDHLVFTGGTAQMIEGMSASVVAALMDLAELRPVSP